MKCVCLQHNAYFELWDGIDEFDAFTAVAKRYDVELRRCPACGAHWQIDVGRGNLAIRIDAPDNWSEFDDRPIRMAHMVAFHGGYSKAVCKYAGCNRSSLNGMVICEHHAYPSLSNLKDT